MKVCPYFVGEKTAGLCARCKQTFKAHLAARGARIMPARDKRDEPIDYTYGVSGLSPRTLQRLLDGSWETE